MRKSVLAIAAHPDDIEIMMAGTMLLLRERGWTLHYFNVSSGSCGSMEMGPEETARVRRREAMRAAEILGAVYHESVAHDLEITYTTDLLRNVASVVREARPRIILTHSLADYMEDHMNTARLAVTAAFSKAMPNFLTEPSRKAVPGDVLVYHALPHGLEDGMRRKLAPELVVDVSAVHRTKWASLAAHQSQKSWLDATQGMDSYLQSMEDASRLVAGKFAEGRTGLAEGWTRHSHLGFSRKDGDPLSRALAGLAFPALQR